MNYTTAIFLINDKVRAIACTYEAGDNASRTIFKTLDPTIKKDDLVIVPTNTRHGMTVVKVAETDVDLDLESSAQVLWIVAAVNRASYDRIALQEKEAMDQIRSAQARKKRDELARALMADAAETIQALPIANRLIDGGTIF